MSQPKLLSGIQPTGDIHLGNYLGAVKQWIEMQETHQTFSCIVDLHAITIPYERTQLHERIFGVAVDLVALGLDPGKATIFVQSQVPEHVELFWLLNTFTPFGVLERMTQFKDKAEQQKDNVSAGLFNYPVLQAADILVYKAEVVPVGEDQKQHLELTRDLARKFNTRFGETFPLPEMKVNEKAPRIMSLADPTKKMSKSLGPAHYIALSDDEMTIRKKIGRAVTDSGDQSQTIDKKQVTRSKKKKLPVTSYQLPVTGDMSPGVKNLFTLLKFFADEETNNHLLGELDSGKLRYASLKPILADAIIEKLKPIQEKRAELLAKPKKIEKMLADGAERARKVASATLKEVKEKMGLL